jgi:YVTN family beta-propeller protein
MAEGRGQSGWLTPAFANEMRRYLEESVRAREVRADIIPVPREPCYRPKSMTGRRIGGQGAPAPTRVGRERSRWCMVAVALIAAATSACGAAATSSTSPTSAASVPASRIPAQVPGLGKIVATYPVLPADADSQNAPAILSASGQLYVADVDGRLLRLDPGTGMTVSGGTVPEGVSQFTSGGGFIWAAANGSRIAQIDPHTLAIVHLFMEPAATAGIAYAGAGLWATIDPGNGEIGGVQPPVDASLNLIGIASGASTKEVPVGALPNFVDSAFGSLWVTNHHSSFVSRVDPVSGRVVASVSTGLLPIGDAAVTDGAGSLWVADWDATTLRRINPLTNRQIAELPVPAYTLTFGDRAVWAVDQNDALLIRVDPATDRMVTAIRIPNGNAAVTFADGDVWVASGGDILKIDPRG